jgi:hypothetical protein
MVKRKTTLQIVSGVLMALVVHPLITSVQASPAIVMQVTHDKVPARGTANAISGSFRVRTTRLHP